METNSKPECLGCDKMSGRQPLSYNKSSLLQFNCLVESSESCSSGLASLQTGPRYCRLQAGQMGMTAGYDEMYRLLEVIPSYHMLRAVPAAGGPLSLLVPRLRPGVHLLAAPGRGGAHPPGLLHCTAQCSTVLLRRAWSGAACSPSSPQGRSPPSSGSSPSSSAPSSAHTIEVTHKYLLKSWPVRSHANKLLSWSFC